MNMNSLPLKGLIAALLTGRREGECFCGHCDEAPRTLEQWRDETTARLNRDIEISKQALTLLADPNRHGKTLMGLEAGGIKLGDADVTTMVVTYGVEGENEYVIDYYDSRQPQPKTFKVHGAQSVQSVIESLREDLFAEVEAFNATAKAAQEAAPQPEAAETKADE